MAARKGQGQWALGYREPLNPNERSKRDNDGLLVEQRIRDIYQHTGFAGIDPADLRGRFRWYGLYTQRRQGIPGGKTATLEPEELEDEFFMLRVRIDGGALTSAQLRVVADISTEYGRDVADIRTDLAGFARSSTSPNLTSTAIAEAIDGDPWQLTAEVPFTSPPTRSQLQVTVIVPVA